MTINPNADEYLPLVGLKDLYIAEVTQDDDSAYVADTPEYFADALEAGVDTEESNDTHYSNDKPSLVLHSEGPTTLSIKTDGIPPEMIAKITGKVFNAASGRIFGVDRVPPDIALSFRSLKTNGKYHYVQYLKGMFSIPKVNRVTKGAKTEAKPSELTYTAIYTKYEFDTGSADESVKVVEGDEDTTNFSGTTWFSQVQTPSIAAPSALALSVADPLDAATGVLVTKTCTLTFNNALIANAIYNVVLIKASDGTVKDSSITLDATKKIVSIDPTTSLTASTDYIITYAVIDIYGQHLSGAINFTTA